MKKYNYFLSFLTELLRYGLYDTVHFQLALLFGWKVTGKTYQLIFPVWSFYRGAVFTLCDINYDAKRFGWIFINRQRQVNLYSSDNKNEAMK